MHVASSLVSVALAAIALTLHGCGGGGDDGTTTPPPAPAPPPPAPTPPSPATPFLPIRGVCYEAVPKQESSPVPPAKDVMQEGYLQQFGADGRDDLGMIKNLGGNSVRLFTSMGLESMHDHSKFLDRAEELGIHVILGFFTQMACPDFDCFDSWRNATDKALKAGFKKDGKWHPAVSMIVLMDQPDNLNFGGTPPPAAPTDPQRQAMCRVRAALSALEAVLVAEADNGVTGTVNMTVSWSSAQRDSIDLRVKDAIGYFGFQDMIAGTADPDIALYEVKRSTYAIQRAFSKRWTHSMASYSAWDFINEKVRSVYKQFEPKPWFISEQHSNGMTASTFQSNLEGIDAEAKKGGYFLGAAVFSFQADYSVDPPLEALFKLGEEQIGETEDACQEDPNTFAIACNKWPVYCLEASPLAKAAAKVWGGKATGHGQCPTTSMDKNMMVV